MQNAEFEKFGERSAVLLTDAPESMFSTRLVEATGQIQQSGHQ